MRPLTQFDHLIRFQHLYSITQCTSFQNQSHLFQISQNKLPWHMSVRSHSRPEKKDIVEWSWSNLNLICIIFDYYLPWFPSEYHWRIMFDHSYCQNIHSRSHNRCFKEFANFRRKIPATKRPFAWGGGGWNAIWQNTVWT